ncbi:MAG TPA: aminotransferase class I/II-fold pyridoxal phosphate-dependent enzyme [Streptosporangiaceae bacterium]|jgi:aspartate/methionine/tyrosine aminotransferase
MVSRQAAGLAARTPAIATAHFRAEAAPYHPVRCPDGYVNLGTAENRLVWDLLAPRLAARRSPAAADTRYAPLYGTPALREVLADLLSAQCRTAVSAEELVVVSGATAALDVLATALCDPDELIVVPAPYYGAFDLDMCGRSRARLVPVPMPDGDGFRLAAGPIDRVLGLARRHGRPARVLALTSPSNPVGHVHSAATLREIADVAACHDVAVIADEIYAGSVFGQDTSFVSLLDPSVNRGHRHRSHLVWGFAKDFGLPGLKVGVAYSPDPAVREAVRALAYFAPTSTDTQALLTALLADPDWVDCFRAESRRRLGASYARCTRLLDELDIPYAPASAGFSIWTDLRRWLTAPTFDAERALWKHIFDGARVNILPGEMFGCPQPGWFRICHTTEPHLVSAGIARLGRVLGPPAPKD